VAVKPYPVSCKHCKSPARQTSSFTICSNLRCKTRHSYRAVLKNYQLPIQPLDISRDEDGFVLCPACHNRARRCDAEDRTRLYCPRDLHTWKLELQLGDKMGQTGNYAFTWNGTRWSSFCIKSRSIGPSVTIDWASIQH